MEVNFDHDFELAPASFTHFVWWFRDYPIRAFVAVVQFEVDLFNVGLHVFVQKRLDINRPRVSVPVFVSLFAKRPGYISVDDRLDLDDSLNTRKTAFK